MQFEVLEAIIENIITSKERRRYFDNFHQISPEEIANKVLRFTLQVPFKAFDVQHLFSPGSESPFMGHTIKPLRFFSPTLMTAEFHYSKGGLFNYYSCIFALIGEEEEEPKLLLMLYDDQT